MNAADAPVRIPWPLATLLGRLPQWPPSAILTTVLNLGLARHLDQDALALLRGKVIRIAVRDAGIACTLSFDGKAFRPHSTAAAADVTISAAAWDFALLASRKEDPDTLFFARRLGMDGDTETGLVVKNMLDAVDPAALFAPLDAPSALLAQLRALLAFRRPSG